MSNGTETDVGTEHFRESMMEAVEEVKTRLETVEKTADLVLIGVNKNTSELADHSRTLFGHEEDRRRGNEPGLVHAVSELTTAFRDVRAVAKAGWAMISLVGLTTVISLVSFLVRVT